MAANDKKITEDEVMKFYVDNIINLGGDETNAMSSWIKLNGVERETIFQKFYENKVEKLNIANFFKTTFSSNNKNINNEIDSINPQNYVYTQNPNSGDSDIIEIVNSAADNQETLHNERFEENVCDSKPTDTEVTLVPIYHKLSKPSQPAVKSASELFEMFKLPEQSWKCLTTPQQRFYYNAFRTIKCNYIDSYEKYLYSLSTEDLYLLHQDTFKEK